MKRGQWLKLIIGLILIFAAFQTSAVWMGSDRGEAGVAVGLLVVACALVAETALFGKSLKAAALALGLGFPAKRGMMTALVVCLLLWFAVLVFARVSKVSFDFYANWEGLLAGLFFQAGIAEETLFRGYLFGHLRERRTFWKAAALAAVPFILVHLILFYSLDWSLAAASILLAVAMSFPLSRLFELGGNTVWAPALVHFVAQATVKILLAEGEAARLFPFFWIAVCALLPFAVFVPPALKKTARESSAT